MILRGEVAIVDDATIVLYVAGAAIVTTYGYLSTPAGQQAIKDGATAIYNGAIIIGQEISEAAWAVVEGAIQGATWLSDTVKAGWNALFSKKTKSSDKEKANDIPSWARGEKTMPGESGKDYAKRLCDEKYGEGNYNTGPGSEYNKLKKTRG